MHRVLYSSMLFATIALTACGGSVPGCNSDSAIQLVKQISAEELERRLGSQLAAEFRFEVHAVRTTSTDDQTGAHGCAAELHMYGNDGSNKLPIEYTVENTDDGEQIYVNVYGL
jgi:hypothetical protein